MRYNEQSLQTLWNAQDSAIRIRREMLEANVIRIVTDCIDIARDTGVNVLGLVYSKLAHDFEALSIADDLLSNEA